MDELVTAGEWTSPLGFGRRPEKVGLHRGSPQFPGGRTGRLSDLSGWWQSVALDDVDGDGRPDVILGNWGLNSAYGLFPGVPGTSVDRTRPLSIFYEGEADSSSGVCLLAYESADGRILPVQGRAELAPRIPWLAERFPTYRSFAMASVPEILGDRMGTFQKRECRWMSSLLLLNRETVLWCRSCPPRLNWVRSSPWRPGILTGMDVATCMRRRDSSETILAFHQDDAGKGVPDGERGRHL